jgi:hypothetical protein
MEASPGSAGASRASTGTPASPQGRVAAAERPADAAPVAGRPAGRRNGGPRRPWDTGTVSVGELAVFAVALVVALVAVAGLALAHLGRYSLTTAGAGALAGLVALAVLARLAGRLPRVVLDLPGLLVLVAAGGLALFMFLPGFHYAAGDRDPGGYLMTAAAIARTGSVTFVDPVLRAHLPVQFASPGARFPGIWVSDPADGLVTPQFYHLWPALLATADRLHGFAGMACATPLVAVVAVLLAVAVARRLGGLVAAGVTGLLLGTHMLEVWQAKYPSAEMLTQLLFMAAVLGLAVALQTGWRWPAFCAGMLVGIGWLARADGLLLVLLVVGAGATLYVLRRFDARGWWCAAGLAVTFPYGAYQAYGPARPYTLDNGIPRLPLVLAAVAGCVVGALVLRRLLWGPLLGGLTGRLTGGLGSARGQRRLGVLLLAVYVLAFGLELARPALGQDLTRYGSGLIRSYDERSIYWLSWFFTWPGLLLVLAGIGVLALSRWTPAPWVVALPTLAFLPLFAWHAKNSPFLMWWGRRYVSTVLPGMVLLIALAVAALWGMRGRPRPAGRGPVGKGVVGGALLDRGAGRGLLGKGVALALTAFLLVIYGHQSLPLRAHDEWGGSYLVTQDMATLPAGRPGVFLWQPARYCCAAPQTLFAAPLWLIQNQQSVLLPTRPALVPGYVGSYLRHFTAAPLYLVYEQGAPPAIPGARVTPVREYAGRLPRWAESSVERPAHALTIPYHFTVYQVTRTR